MNLQIGIVGLPNVGKSTLFNALTKKGVPAENYPFCTIDPSVGIVAVPDERLNKLTEFSKSEKTIPAAIQFVDIAGLVRGAAAGEGLGNQFLSHIREVNAIAQVVRVFEDKDVIHVENKVDPAADIGTINLELALADLDTVRKRRASIGREVKRGDKEAVLEESVLARLEQALGAGEPARSVKLEPEEAIVAKGYHLLTSKPVIYVFNFSTASNQVDTSFRSKLDGKVVEIDPVFETGFDDLIKASYELLGLMTYFTTGVDETRAWTIPVGSTAPEAGAAIHTDFQHKFIRAEVINWKTLLDAGSYAAARDKGLLRTEGKLYIVADGDVIEFRI